jgi:PAS domain S-box-containing protein
MWFSAPLRTARRFRDLPLSTKGLAVVAIPLAGLIAVTLAFYFVQRANQDAMHGVTHTLEVRSEIQTVHTRLEEAETSVLGYLLTREKDWLTPYEEARQQLPAVLDRLESMVRDNSAQLGRVQMIKALVRRQFEAWGALPELVPAYSGLHPPLVESRDRLDSIRRLLAETQAAEDRLLEQRRAHAKAVYARGYAVIAAGILFAPLGAIAAILLFTSAISRRIKVLQANAVRLAEGQPIARMRFGNDEIGRLEESLSDAAALLADRERELRHARDELESRVDERTSELADVNRALGAEVGERQLAQEEASDVNRRLQAVIDASPLAIMRLGLGGQVMSWNHAAVRIFGWEMEEVLNRPLPPLPDEDGAPLHALLAGAALGEALVGLETRRRRKDGKLIDVRLWTAPLRGASGAIRGSVVIAADFTEQRQLEQQLTQAQKMEAIGRLAGGVAHDFNNVITIVAGYGHILREGNKDNPDLRDAAEEVIKAAERSAALASQLLVFSRRQAIRPKVIDLNAEVRNIERMLTRVIGEDVELDTLLRPETGAVRGDAGQLEQVLLNLVLNARDAMPSGGRLTIETANVTLDESYARTHAGVVPGKYVMLAVSDSGIGMDAETQEHIFEPFFTTKERGKGTGLGLSTVYGIIKQHGGDIWVYSEPGRGTTFKIYLPRVDAAAAAGEKASKADPSPSGEETVLLVEDEDAVRKLVRGVLDQHGYHVLEADSGARALEVVRDFDGTIDLLLTDVVMPKMSGRDLAEALALLRPEVKVLYLSGYTERSVFDQGLLDRRSPFLQKPFTPDTLARKIRDVLDSRSRAVQEGES